jgi:hypothetical protein
MNFENKDECSFLIIIFNARKIPNLIKFYKITFRWKVFIAWLNIDWGVIGWFDFIN